MFDPTQLRYSLVRQSLVPEALLWVAGTVALLWMDWPAIGLALLAACGIRGLLAWSYAEAAAKGLAEERQVRTLNWALGLPDGLVEALVRKYRLGGWSRGPLVRVTLSSWLTEPRLSPWDLVMLDMDAADARSALHQKARRAANAEYSRSQTIGRLGELHSQETALLAALPTTPPYGFVTWLWIAVRGRWWRLRDRRRMRAVDQQPAERADEVQP